MKLYRVILFCFFLIINQVKAIDTANIDSLKLMLDTSSSVNKIFILNKLFEISYNTDSAQALKYIDSSLFEIYNLPNLENRVTNIISLTITLNRKGKYKYAIQYLYDFLKTEQKNLTVFHEARIYREIGNYYFIVGEYGEALSRYMISLKKFERDTTMKKDLANSYNNLGITYKSLGNSEEALKYQIKALNIREEINDKAGLIMSYNNIGQIYYFWNDFEKTIEYFKSALKLSKELKAEKNIALLSNNIGSVYIEMNELDKAIEYFYIALGIYENNDEEFYCSIIYSNIASVYRDKGNYSKSLDLYEKSLSILKRFNNLAEITKRLNDVAKVYYLMNEYDKALNYINQINKIKLNNPIPELELSNKELIYLIYKAKGNYKDAILSLEMWNACRDSIYNKEKHEQIAEIQAKYENEKKQKEIELLDKENQIKQLQVKRQGLIIFISFIGLIILVVLIIFYIRQNRKINIINKGLEREKQKITDSIEYAEKIQTAILPPKEHIDNILTDYFIYYKPCHTISGDFYWIDEIADKIIIAVADCTGHGVPGGLLSTLGISILKESILKSTELKPSKILENLNYGLNAALHQTALDSPNSNDGMEIGLLIIDKTNMTVQFSGAKSVFYLLRNHEITVVSGNRRAIGYQKQEKTFINTIFNILPDDKLYLFTDGIVHQIGGEKRKLFSKTRLKNMLIEFSGLSLFQQRIQIIRRIEEWMKDYEQLDDMLIIGIKI